MDSKTLKISLQPFKCAVAFLLGGLPVVAFAADDPEAAKPAAAYQAIIGTEGQLTPWFTASSGKRHNSRCHDFRTTEGRLCSPDEGKRCKLCGG